MKHRDFMNRAIELAKKAYDMGEVPVGAVIVKNGEIIAEGWNTRESEKNALGHAEIMAIEKACRVLNDWRLDGCTLYVTMEPCVMCTGAIINSRISTVVYSLIDFTAGGMGGKINMMSLAEKTEIIHSVCEDESRRLIDAFFAKLRNKNKD